MEPNTTPTPFLPSPFLSDGRQWAFNSTSLGLAKECLRKYYYAFIEGWSPRILNDDITFGLYYAAALESYHKCRSDLYSMTHNEAVHTVVGQTLQSVKDWESEHRFKNRETLIRSIVWYLEEFRDDPCTTIILKDGRPAVELTFSFEFTPEITFCGHLDRLVEYAGDYYIQDQKAQPLTTKVLTLNGWRQIGDLRLGDEVIGAAGTSTTVIGLYPKGQTATYRVTFNDNTSVLCGADHLWTVSDQLNSTWRTLDIKELITHKGWQRYHIPLVQPVQHPRRDLPLDPYVLGVLLGDGYFGGNSPQLSTSHEWLAEAVGERLPLGDTIRKHDAENYTWGIKGQATTTALKELGLWGKLSATKFIPEIYLFASESQRRDLLRGLLVTDGTWDGRRRKYDSTSIHLIEGVCALVRSLGGNARYSKRTGEKTGWRVSLRLPTLPTGAGKRYIKSIVEDMPQETMCIKVAADDGLYVTENYIVTHNTTGASLSSYYFKRFTPDNQMTLYTAAGQIVWNTPVKGVMIDAAQIAVGFTRFERGFAFRTQEQIEEWLVDAEWHIHNTWEATIKNNFPMNDKACMLYGGCQFLGVCSKSPQVREEFLKTDFEKKFRNPLEVR